MTNGEFVDDKKIKDILTYIKSMKHAEQIRMMFLFSLNGLRSINFTYLHVKDCYTDQLKPKDVISLNNAKHKGKHACEYFMNSQMKTELGDYLQYLQNTWGESVTPATYLFTSQKLNKPYNRVSISRLFGSVYNKFGIKGASHLGRHLFVSKLVNSGVSVFVIQKLVNHRNITTTQRYFNHNEQMLANAVENTRI